MKLLAGPCVIEGREPLMRIAKLLRGYNEDKRFSFYFKASFDKANRTSLDSYRGPGLEEGLRLLEEVKQEFGVKSVTGVHESGQVASVAEVADMLQIPAFLSRQSDLLIACAKTNREINIKKGQFLDAEAMRYSLLKVLKSRGCSEASYAQSAKLGVYLCERGNSFGYGNLVVDMRNLVIMRRYAPVIFDATHSVQMPSAAGGKSGGDSSFVPYLALAAAAVGVDGYFFETHYDPSSALSDGPNMITPDILRRILERIESIEQLGPWSG